MCLSFPDSQIKHGFSQSCTDAIVPKILRLPINRLFVALVALRPYNASLHHVPR